MRHGSPLWIQPAFHPRAGTRGSNVRGAHQGCLVAELRRAGVATDMAFRGNMKRRMAKANDQGARYALILGDDELANDKVQVKALKTGDQAAMPLSWVPQGIFDLLFEDQVAEDHGEQLPPLAQRLTTA